LVISVSYNLSKLHSVYGVSERKKNKVKVKVKGKFTLKQATKDQRRSRGTNLLLL